MKKVDQRKLGRPPPSPSAWGGGGMQSGASTPKHSSSSADKLSSSNGHDGCSERCRWCVAPTNRCLCVSSPKKKKKISLSSYFHNRHLKRSRRIIRRVSVTPGPKHSSAAEQGTCVSETQTFQRRRRLCIPGVFGIQAYIITVSSARFPPEYAEQKKKKKNTNGLVLSEKRGGRK